MNRMSTRILIAAPLAAALLLAACGGGDAEPRAARSPRGQATGATPTGATPDGTPTGGDRVEVEVEAEDFSFEPATVTVPAGADLELKFKNRDEGVPHTFSVYETEAAQQEIFSTGNLIGDREETFDFTAPSESGTYFFRCDVHPEDMTGDFVVE